VWQVYLGRATAAGDDSLFEAALSYCKTQSQRVTVMRGRATSAIKQGRLDLAAVCYAQSGLSFDEVALCLLNCVDAEAGGGGSMGAGAGTGAGASGGGGAGAGAFQSIASAEYKPNNNNNNKNSGGGSNNSSSSSMGMCMNAPSLVQTAITTGAALTPLRVFLMQVLRGMPSSAKMQRSMLCTWLTDLYLHQIHIAEMEEGGRREAEAEADAGVEREGEVVYSDSPDITGCYAAYATTTASTYASTSSSSSPGSGQGGQAQGKGQGMQGQGMGQGMGQGQGMGMGGMGGMGQGGMGSELDGAALQTQFRDFLRAHKSSLSKHATLQLILARNHTPLLLFFAQIVGDYHRCVYYTYCLLCNCVFPMLYALCATSLCSP
jgi:hypothetical protein